MFGAAHSTPFIRGRCCPVHVQMIPYLEIRRRRCDCCDRTANLAAKLLLMDGRALLGDLELCGTCAAAFGSLAQETPGLVREEGPPSGRPVPGTAGGED